MKVTMIDENELKSKIADATADITTKIDGLVAELEAVKKEYQARGQVVLKEAFAEFFVKHPKVKMITWTQYTPYFNDGDTCEFRTGDFWMLSEEGMRRWDEDGGHAEEYDIIWGDEDIETPLTKEEKDAAKNDLRTIARIPDEIYEDLFGDHVQVKATAEGFDVEEYSHD